MHQILFNPTKGRGERARRKRGERRLEERGKGGVGGVKKRIKKGAITQHGNWKGFGHYECGGRRGVIERGRKKGWGFWWRSKRFRLLCDYGNQNPFSRHQLRWLKSTTIQWWWINSGAIEWLVMNFVIVNGTSPFSVGIWAPSNYDQNIFRSSNVNLYIFQSFDCDWNIFQLFDGNWFSKGIWTYMNF